MLEAHRSMRWCKTNLHRLLFIRLNLMQGFVEASCFTWFPAIQCSRFFKCPCSHASPTIRFFFPTCTTVVGKNCIDELVLDLCDLPTVMALSFVLCNCRFIAVFARLDCLVEEATVAMRMVTVGHLF